jgi:hypothetical protein
MHRVGCAGLRSRLLDQLTQPLRAVSRAGPDCLNRFSASISGASAGGCQAVWRLVEVGLIRSGVVKALVRSTAIVEVEMPADRGAGLADVVVGSQLHFFIFDAAPQPLDEHVVALSPFAVHADGDVVLGEHADEGGAGKLQALIGVEDVGPAVMSQSIL